MNNTTSFTDKICPIRKTPKMLAQDCIDKDRSKVKNRRSSTAPKDCDETLEEIAEDDYNQ